MSFQGDKNILYRYSYKIWYNLLQLVHCHKLKITENQWFINFIKRFQDDLAALKRQKRP